MHGGTGRNQLITSFPAPLVFKLANAVCVDGSPDEVLGQISAVEAAQRLDSRRSNLMQRLYLVRVAPTGQAFVVSGKQTPEPKSGDYLLELQPSGAQRQWLVQGA